MKTDPTALFEPRPRPSRGEAEAAVRTLLRWIGEDPDRPGLRATPGRVASAYEEWFGGYGQDPVAILRTTFDETGGYDEVVLLRDVGFVSHCEHHLAPIVGRAHVAYLPDRRVVGISKLARVVDVFARRLQIQERMTAEVADAVQEALAAARGGGGGRGGAPLHDDARRVQARQPDDHEPAHRGVPGRPLGQARAPYPDRPVGRVSGGRTFRSRVRRRAGRGGRGAGSPGAASGRPSSGAGAASRDRG